MPKGVRLADGTLDFSGGVDSARVTTVQSASNPNGLPRTMLAWANNATVRDGGISPRPGWTALITQALNAGIYQGGYSYVPNGANPYLILSIGGHIFSALMDPPYTVTDLSVQFKLFNPPTIPQCFMSQAEQFLIIQAGDYLTNPKPTLPLFWDGTTLRRSVGIISANNTPNGGVKPFNEIPAATCMCYYQGRLWYAQQRTVSAGDIVGGPSGTAQYLLFDSVLKVTENPLAVGGDGFNVPSTAGNIQALDYSANLDSTLGQGPLYIFTRKQIYQLIVPITRTNWIAATSSNGPQMNVVQRQWGSVSDRCVVAVNGDLFYQSLEPGIRSLFVSLRYFSQWGNVSLSRNVIRALNFNNRALMPTSTGIQFDNRLLQGILPVQTPVGVAFQGIVPLDFDIISQFGSETLTQTKVPPAWEGIWEGLDILQLFADDFGGLERAFAVIHSRVDGSIQVWELTSVLQFENGDNRIGWLFETPSYTFGTEFEMKKLDGGEIWLDSVFGTVDLLFEYRVDSDACWRFWHQQEMCVARSSCEDLVHPVCYPIQQYCQGYKYPLTLPEPEADKCATLNHRPTNIGYQFQIRVTVKGAARVRGLLLYAVPVERRLYEGLEC